MLPLLALTYGPLVFPKYPPVLELTAPTKFVSVVPAIAKLLPVWVIVTSPLSKFITPPSAKNKSDHLKEPFPKAQPSSDAGDKLLEANKTSSASSTLNAILLSVWGCF